MTITISQAPEILSRSHAIRYDVEFKLSLHDPVSLRDMQPVSSGTSKSTSTSGSRKELEVRIHQLTSFAIVKLVDKDTVI